MAASRTRAADTRQPDGRRDEPDHEPRPSRPRRGAVDLDRQAAAADLDLDAARPPRCAMRGAAGACRSGAGAHAAARSGDASAYTWTSAQPSPGWPRGRGRARRRNWPFATTTVVARPREPRPPVDADRDVRRPSGPPQPIRRRPEHHRVDGSDGADRFGGAVVGVDRERVDRDLGGAGSHPTRGRGRGRGRTGARSEAHERTGPAHRGGDEGGVVAGDLDVGRAGRVVLPTARRGARGRGHRPTTLDAAIDAAEAGVGRGPRRRRRSPAFGATSPIWRSRSITCLTLRTKSPPVISSSSRTSARSSPATQAYIVGDETRVQCARLRQAGVVLGVVEVLPDAFDRTPPLWRARARATARREWTVAVGARRWYVKHDTTPAISAGSSRRGAPPERLGDDEVALGVEAGEELAPLGERPVFDVAPRFEDAQHPVELAGEALAAPAHPALEARRRRGRGARPTRRPATRASCSRSPATGCPASCASSSDARSAWRRSRSRRRRRAEPARDGGDPRRAPEVAAARRERHGQLDVRRGRRGPVEVAGAQPEELAAFAEREHLRGAAGGSARDSSTATRPRRPGRTITSPGRRRSIASAARPEVRRPRRSASSAALQAAVLVDVAGSPPGRVAVSGQRPRGCARSWRSSPTTSRSAWNCANDRFRRWCATSARVPLHEVRGHVVGRPERRRERVRAARRQRRDLVEGHERVPQHDRVPDVVDAAPPGAPGELGVLTRREELVVLAGELRQLLDHHRPGRHVDPERQRLGREHDLHAGRRRTPPRPPPSSAGPCRRDGRRRRPRDRRATRRSRAPRGRRRTSAPCAARRCDGAPCVRPRVGEPEPVGEALLHGLVAPGAAEHERDRREHPLARTARSTTSVRRGVRSRRRGRPRPPGCRPPPDRGAPPRGWAAPHRPARRTSGSRWTWSLPRSPTM